MRGFPVIVSLVAAVAAATNSSCADGLYMIVARGTLEPKIASPQGYFPADTGSPGYVAQLIAAKIKGSKIAGVKYPASMQDPSYAKSEDDGAATMLQMAKEYHSSCPSSKMALLGYSQIFPRHNITVCERYDDIMASWCDKGDKYCDSGKGQDGTIIHGSYLGIYNSTMVDFVVERWQKSTTTGTSTGSPTSSATSSPSPSTGTASGLTADQSFFMVWPLLLLSCGLFF
ncbi:hypothetical protein N7510_010949 [Penicillium lagena]|uniref:uncharacterized protein n=1 Tax=Penicillium lagena TaxID=94218 RepID=UPI00253FBD5F|nr:uncharacterized protein N7510_010949 [Penicillium lagena]KAJ5601415.1 hypothetical protein N7510_010949 [Penicillium lagena]